MWDLPRPRIEPVSPALEGRFLSTGPPGKSHKVSSEFSREGCIIFSQRETLEEVKPEYLVTKNAIYHTLQWLSIVLRIKNLAGLQDSWWRLNPHLPTTPCLYSNYIILSFFEQATLFFQSPWTCGSFYLFSCLSSFPPFTPLFLHVSARLSLLPRNLPWSHQPRLASFVLCLQGTVFFSFRALMWSFNHQPTGVIRWWMSVFPFLTLRSMSIPKENCVCFAHHCRQHPTWCFKHGRSSMTLDGMNEGEESWNASKNHRKSWVCLAWEENTPVERAKSYTCMKVKGFHGKVGVHLFLFLQRVYLVPKFRS